MNNRLKILFVDHSFHGLTGSSRFFTDILRAHADVVTLSCDAWRGGHMISAHDVDSVGADVTVFWQTLPNPSDLLRLRTPAVWVPMYDSAIHKPALYWNLFSQTGISVISFCRALSVRLRRYGIPVSDYTYYPDASRIPMMQDDHPGLRVFLWDRGDVGCKQLIKLIGRQRVEYTILRLLPDPGLLASRVTPRDIDALGARLVVGPLTQQEHLRLLSSCNIFVAPRRTEGIGMSFLEAMAMGLAVIAPNRPTMNEYIKQGINGYLYDPLRIDAVDLSESPSVGRLARQSMLQGYEEWSASTGRLITDLRAAKARPGLPSRRVIAMAEIMTAEEYVKNVIPLTCRARLIRVTRLGLRG